MHSFWNRVNTLISLFAIVGGALCMCTATTDMFHKPSPAVDISVDRVLRFIPFGNNQEQAVISLNVDADLRSAFSWNTKQLFVQIQAEYAVPNPVDPDPSAEAVAGAAQPGHRVAQAVLWDAIIEDRSDALLQVNGMRPKYALSDPGGLRGTPFNLSIVWNVMPRVGYLYSRQHTVSAGSFPKEYVY